MDVSETVVPFHDLAHDRGVLEHVDNLLENNENNGLDKPEAAQA
jgi:hypothetical protein